MTLQAPAVHAGLAASFAALDDEGIEWALVRGADELASPVGDVDLLVAAHDRARLDSVLRVAGFGRVPAPGHGSHRFFFAYRSDEDRWLKLDVVFEVEFGPLQQFRTRLARGCLARRRRAGGLWRLDSADEGWLILLHLLLDKGEFAADRQVMATTVAARLSVSDPVARALAALAGPDAPERILELVSGGRFDHTEMVGDDIRTTWRRRRPVSVPRTRLVHRLRRRAPSSDRSVRRRSMVVAVLGPDGSGKTTLIESLVDAFPLPARTVYMGLWQAGPWDHIVRVVPGLRTAQLLSRLARSAIAVQHQRLRGRLVLVDRFAYDSLLVGAGGGLGASLVRGWTSRWLPRPDLVLLLDAPGEILYARKREHSPEQLERWRQEYRAMVDQLPVPVAIIDAVQQQAGVRRTAVATVWRSFIASGARP